MSPDSAENEYHFIRIYANNKEDFIGLKSLRITTVL